MSTAMNEDQAKRIQERKAETYFKRYRPQMEALESQYTPLKKARSITQSDYAALGERLEQFENYLGFVNETGNVNDLGTIPTMGLDLITAVYGSSVNSIIASQQTIPDERGLVWFKELTSQTTRGNITSGQVLTSATAPSAYAQGFAAERQSLLLTNSAVTSALSPTSGAQGYGLELVFAGAGVNIPMRPRTVRITAVRSNPTSPSLTLTAMDPDGDGNIYGRYLTGTVDYATGAANVMIADPSGSVIGNTQTFQISMSYGTDFEEAGNLPKVSTRNISTMVEAEIFALGSDIGMFKAYNLRQRFGTMADDEMIADLTNELVAETTNTLLQRIYNSAMGFVTWDRAPQVGVPLTTHNQELVYTISRAEAKLLNNAGRGIVNVVIAGSSVCAVFDTIPGFQKSGISNIGAHLYGVLNNSIVVIRAPQYPPDEAIAMFKGPGYFDTSAVEATYMPLFLTSSIPVANNPLKTQAVAATWTALQVLVPNYITKIVTVPA